MRQYVLNNKKICNLGIYFKLLIKKTIWHNAILSLEEIFSPLSIFFASLIKYQHFYHYDSVTKQRNT
jgi:hypothetical protein